MPRPKTKRDLDILEERGLWKAAAFMHHLAERLAREGLPLTVGHLRHAHRLVFAEANPPIAGKFRRDNPEVKRVDGSVLPLAHWREVSRHMMVFDAELRDATAKLRLPKTDADYQHLVSAAAQLSHRLAVIHPFENGNGRLSRLLVNAIFQRAGLPDIALKVEKRRYLRAMRQADDHDFRLLGDLILAGIVESRRKLYAAVRRRVRGTRRRRSGGLAKSRS